MIDSFTSRIYYSPSATMSSTTTTCLFTTKTLPIKSLDDVRSLGPEAGVVVEGGDCRPWAGPSNRWKSLFIIWAWTCKMSNRQRAKGLRRGNWPSGLITQLTRTRLDQSGRGAT